MAAKLGLEGLNYGTSRHSFITTRMENMGVLHEQLQDLVGDKAIPLIAETIEALPDIPTRSDVLAVFRRELANPEEVELLCNALQEAWQAVDLLQERLGDEQALVDLSSVAAFASVDLLKDRFGDEQTRKLLVAP